MQKKNVLVILLTIVVFLSAVVLGVTTVYRVDTVTLNASVVSKAAKVEAEALQERLIKAYEKQSVFSVNSKKAEEIMKEFPYFRMTGFEKAYPNRIIISTTEDAEIYAIPVTEDETSYYILGLDGSVLGIRETYVNRLDGADNLLIKGLTVTGEKGKIPTGDDFFAAVIMLLRNASETLGGVRRNAMLVEVIRMTSSAEESIIRITMREGVKLYIGNLSVLTEEKANAAFNKYLSLSDEERLTGRIAVSDRAGEVIISYAEKDEFIS